MGKRHVVVHRAARAARRRPRATSALAALALGAVLVNGCSGSSGAGPTKSPPVAPVTPTAVPTPTVTPTLTAAPSPSVEASPTPEPTPVVFDSVAYGYRARFPAGGLVVPPREALERWDGQATINSDGQYTDKFYRPGSRLLFVYGESTDLSLADYAAEGQRQKASWHGCPVTPETVVETTFAGQPALLHSFPCQGTSVLSLFTIRDGYGVVFNQLAPPGNEAADQADFLDLLATWIWLD